MLRRMARLRRRERVGRLEMAHRCHNKKIMIIYLEGIGEDYV